MISTSFIQEYGDRQRQWVKLNRVRADQEVRLIRPYIYGESGFYTVYKLAPATQLQLFREPMVIKYIRNNVIGHLPAIRLVQKRYALHKGATTWPFPFFVLELVKQ